MWNRDLGPAGYVNCKYVIKCQAQKTSFFYSNDFPEIKNDPIFLQGNLTAGIFVHKMSSKYSKKRTVMNIHSHVVCMCKENLNYSTCVMIIYYNAITMSWWISQNSVSMILLSNQIKPMIEILI